MKGIDISRWNAGLNFKSVKKQGYEFIIPRDGWGTDIDPQLDTFVKQAKANGIEIPGVYHFIYAISTEEVIRNAQTAIENVEKVGLPKSTIIWCDLEYDTVDKAKAKGVILTEKMQKEFVETFCNYILTQGYPTGVYVNQDYMLRVFGKDFGKDYDLWLSDLEGEPAYQCVYRQTGYGNVDGIAVDENVYYGQYTAGTAKPKTVITEKEDTMAKPKASEFAQELIDVPKRATRYKNKFPWNIGLFDGTYLWNDCWNLIKAIIWGLYLKAKLSKFFTKGDAAAIDRYTRGIKASGLGDVVGDVIIDNYSTQTTFRKLVSSNKPGVLLINGQHMGGYIGKEITVNGKIYNATESTNNVYLGGGTCHSYVDEYGQRKTHKFGSVIGAWNRCGYLTSVLDYSEYDKDTPTPAPTPTPSTISDTDLAIEILRGKWGVNPTRRTDITNKYGAEKYTSAQKKVDSIISALNWYRIEVQLADEILNKKWGNNPSRQANVTAKYGANAYRIAQMFVNDIDGSHKYTIDDLKTAYAVASDMIYGVYGDGAERRKKVVEKYGETIRSMAQGIVDDILK